MTVTLVPRGPFSLTAAATFAEGFPGTEADRPDGELRFAWALDDDWRTASVTVRQDEGGVHVDVAGDVPEELARRDVERIFCLDVDGTGFAAIGERDPVVGALQRRFAGLRPVLFYTPYEAAAWTIIGQRIRMPQTVAIKQRLAAELGEDGAFPAPERLAALDATPRGLTDRKRDQLRGLGAAALDGRLSRDRLRALAPEDADAELQQLAGIGPFAAGLIMIRGVGLPDAFPSSERRFERALRTAYRLDDDAEIEPIAEAWRPYRSWVALLLRVSAAAG